jgi:hypothetical protein
MSAIEVERIGGGSSDKKHAYEVVIDGQLRGCVKCGETRIFEVPPGIHTVKLGLDVNGSPPVKVVVGMGKTSLICKTRTARRFPFFAPSVPSTRILVREDVDMMSENLQMASRVSVPDLPWQREAMQYGQAMAQDRMASD